MIKRFLSLIFVILTLVSLAAGTGVEAKTIEELKEEKRKLTEQIAKKNKELAAIEDEVVRRAAILRDYESMLADIQELMDITWEYIEQIKVHLTETQQKLDLKERELKDYYAMFGKRIRYLHMNNTSSSLAMILGAESFSDALILGQYMSKISQHDTALIDGISSMRDDIMDLRNSINRDLSDQETLMDEYGLLKERATELVLEAQSNLSYAQAERYATKEQIAALLQAEEDMQAEINEKMSVWSDVPYVGGNFRWPVPGYTYVSSGYGWRTLYGQSNFHAGIDIAGSGIYGKAVIASNSGTVSTVVYSSVGYGNYIILDHGGGYMTLYGHLSSIFVSQGETMKQGDAIGAVGSTGNSTGPHLHFEIRIQGEKVDPNGILLNH